MKTFNTSDYLTREDLDRAVVNEVGTDSTIKMKTEFVIVGSSEDLKRLHLSEDSNIYGVRITINE